MATRAISHPSHQVNTSPKTASETPPNFCKDCEVMFESSKSLEVHLSYHKENLLSRWANPETNSPTIMESNKNSQTQPSTISPRDGGTQNNGPTSGHPPYFHPEHGLGLYLTPQYNSNTGDRSTDTQVTSMLGVGLSYRPIPTYSPLEQHQSYGNGIPTTMSNSVQGHQYSSTTQQNFSPNQQNRSTNRPGENTVIKQERGSETPAEILDLDSHKVHVYQHPQQPGDPMSRNNFYRPYLPHLLPPPLSNSNNGWPPPSHPHDQFSPSYPQEHHSNMPIPHPYGIPPQPSGNISYDIIREDGHRNGTGAYQGDPLPPSRYSPQLGPLTPSFRGSFPHPPNISQHPLIENANPLPLPIITGNSRNTSSPKKSPAVPTSSSGVTSKKNNSAANANGAAPKTKGWKGGECKRPKTYNCVACNKWFTSSGHLKRHYGTTLHKNSVKQKGESPEEQQPTRRKVMGAKKSPGDKMTTGGDSNTMEATNIHRGPLETGGGASSSPRSTIVKHEDSTSSGKSTPIFGNNNNAPNGRDGDFNIETSNPSYVTNPYLPYNCVQPPSIHSQYVLQNHFSSPGSVSFSNGFTSDTGAPIGVYSVPSSMVPTAMYNGGYSVISTNVESPLPPFSTVGFSHYDPNSFAHMTSIQGNPFPPHSSPSPVSQQRMTPNGNGGQIYHGGIGPQLSPPRTNNNMENTFGPDSRNCTNSLNRDSPEAVRSASTASGSMEGSLDEISTAGSPLQSLSLSDMSSGTDSLKGDGGDSDPGDPVLKCPECSKTFGRSCYLTQHTNSSHSGGKPFKCSTCGKRFYEEPALSDHLAKHGSDKPYKCSLCPKQFNHKTDLRRHLCLHTGEKPYVCNVCGKGFIRKDHMSKHCETHRKQNSNKVKHVN